MENHNHHNDFAEYFSKLESANKLLGKKLIVKDRNELIKICDEFVMGMIDYVQTLWGSDTEAADLLEDYSRILYNLSFEPQSIDVRPLRNKLVEIKECIAKMD